MPSTSSRPSGLAGERTGAHWIPMETFDFPPPGPPFLKKCNFRHLPGRRGGWGRRAEKPGPSISGGFEGREGESPGPSLQRPRFLLVRPSPSPQNQRRPGCTGCPAWGPWRGRQGPRGLGGVEVSGIPGPHAEQATTLCLSQSPGVSGTRTRQDGRVQAGARPENRA